MFTYDPHISESFKNRNKEMFNYYHAIEIDNNLGKF